MNCACVFIKPTRFTFVICNEMLECVSLNVLHERMIFQHNVLHRIGIRSTDFFGFDPSGIESAPGNPMKKIL